MVLARIQVLALALPVDELGQVLALNQEAHEHVDLLKMRFMKLSQLVRRELGHANLVVGYHLVKLFVACALPLDAGGQLLAHQLPELSHQQLED